MHKLSTLEFKEFLESLFDFLENRKIPYAVARNYESLLDGNPGRDMDILIEEKNIDPVIAFFKHMGITITSIVKREYVMSVFCMGIRWADHLSLGVDFVHKLNYKACAYLDLSGVLKRRRPYSQDGRLFYIPDAVDEILILLMEGLLAGRQIQELYWQRIISCPDLVTIGEKRVKEVFGSERTKRLFDQIAKKNLAGILSDRKTLVASLIRKTFLKHPFYTSKQILIHALRELSIRFSRRSLFTAAFLGPDGAGKSTLISHMALKAGGMAGKIEIRHLKPVFLFKKRTESRGIVTEPHAKPLRGWAMSNLKIILWWMELWVDRIIRLPRTTTLDIFDRCMWDILVDPKRYRFNGSTALLNFLLKSSPEIDIIIVIVAPAGIIQGRKAEVPLEETIRQVDRYIRLAKENHFLLMMNDKDIDTAVQPGLHQITKAMSIKTSPPLSTDSSL